MPIPQIANFGNSFGIASGVSVFDTVHKGEIIASALGTQTMADIVEFSKFEEIIKDFVLARLGYPVVKVELTPYQVKTAIDEAIVKFSYHCPMWAMNYLVFNASAGINIYELPSYVIDNLNFVAYNNSLLGALAQAGTMEADFWIAYLSNSNLFNSFNVGDFYIFQSYIELVRKVLGQDGMWSVLNNRYLVLTPPPQITPEPVIVEYRAIDSNTIHPAYRNWIQRYTLAICKGILSQSRGKFQSLPGPQGGTTLNGPQLQEQSDKEKEQLEQELLYNIEEPALPVIY